MARHDKLMARMASILVHDFQGQIIDEAKSEIKHGLVPDYKRCIQGIEAWARLNGYSTIHRHACKILESLKGE